MILILLRHGQTLFNQLDYTQGWFDSPLTDLGIRQAKRAAELLKDEKIDLAFSSYSERAYDTTEYALGTRNLKIIREKRLKEINFGVFEGNPNSLFHSMIGELSILPKCDGDHFGGESEEEVTRRELEFIDELYSKYPDKTILLGGHGCSLQLLFNALAKESLKQYDPNYVFMGNADAMKIQYNGSDSNILKIYRNGVVE